MVFQQFEVMTTDELLAEQKRIFDFISDPLSEVSQMTLEELRREMVYRTVVLHAIEQRVLQHIKQKGDGL